MVNTWTALLSGEGLLAERVGLELAAEQQPDFARCLVREQRRDQR
jgi:hypothetical protein